LDLLIPGQSPGIKERLVDLYNKPEILFFGPDGAHTLFEFNIRMFTGMLFPEGTADMMDWAARTSLLYSYSVHMTFMLYSARS
jgi:glutamate dehydrogenase